MLAHSRHRFLLGAVTAASIVGTTPALSATRPLKILFSAPLTGDFVEPGRDLLAGAQLATAYFNSHGGVKTGPWKGSRIELVQIDDQMSSKAGSEIGTQFLSDDSYF